MKTLRIDEWIIREVIDTLYMARITLLEITALDSPQEVAKKEIDNECAITRRISKAIDIIQQCKELPEQPQRLDEAAKKDYKKLYEDIVNSDWYKKTYIGKSLGDFIPVEGLDEAAETFAWDRFPQDNNAAQRRGARIGFKAGAKWVLNHK